MHAKAAQPRHHTLRHSPAKITGPGTATNPGAGKKAVLSGREDGRKLPANPSGPLPTAQSEISEGSSAGRQSSLTLPPANKGIQVVESINSLLSGDEELGDEGDEVS